MSSQAIGQLYILVARPPQVVTMKSDGSEVKVLLPDAKDTPDGIAIDSDSGHIYWTNMGHSFSENDGYIQRMRLDGTEIVTLVQPGQTFTPKQLVLDLPNGKIYWSDREGMRVMRSNLDGSDVTVLVRTGTTDADRADETLHCVGIAIDTAGQEIYWTQKGPSDAGKGRIFRAGLELPKGQNPDTRSDIELLFGNLPEPIDLELDLQGGYLYWTDRGNLPQGNSLNRAKVAGELGAHEVLAGGLVEGIGVARAETLGSVFTSDLGGFIRRFDGPTFDVGTVVAELKKPLTGIAFSSVS